MSDPSGRDYLALDMGRFSAALSKLTNLVGGRQIPIVLQVESAECGAACLTMVLGFHGQEHRLEELRHSMDVDTLGVDAQTIIAEAQRHGASGRGVRIEPEDLRHLPRGTILHWELNHFVVFDRISRRGVHIVDPAHGRRVVPMARFHESFTGVALIIEPTGAFRQKKRRKSLLWQYFKPMLLQPGVGRAVVMSIVLRLFALAIPVFMGLVVDRIVPDGDLHLLKVAGIGLGFLLVFTLLTHIVRGHLLLQLRGDLDSKMTLGLLDRLVDLPFSFFQRRSMGDLMMRVNSNALVRETLTSGVLSSLLDGIFVVVYLALIALASAQFAVLVGALALAQVVVLAWAKPRYRDLMAENVEAQSKSQAYLSQMLGGIQTLKVCGAEGRALQRWSNLFVDELNAVLKRGRVALVVEGILRTLDLGAPLLVLTLGTMRVIEGSLTLGTMLALNALAVGFLMPLGKLVENILQIQLLESHIERIDDIHSATPEQDRATAQRPKMNRYALDVEIDQVSFRYNERLNWVLEKVNLTVKPGRSTALVGPSGSGKSTLAHLFLGLIRPDSGSISVGGNDLERVDLRWLRQQVGVVPQTPYIFAGSLRDNLTLAAPEASMEDLVAACKLACIHDAISALPMGYETLVADGGSTLSGGQRQRVALARALVRRPSLLVLDEATSELDTMTEARVMQNLETLRCTRIIIAHRLATVLHADEIAVLHRGQVVERGTHQELLNEDGLYRELVAAQNNQQYEAVA